MRIPLVIQRVNTKDENEHIFIRVRTAEGCVESTQPANCDIDYQLMLRSRRKLSIGVSGKDSFELIFRIGSHPTYKVTFEPATGFKWGLLSV